MKPVLDSLNNSSPWVKGLKGLIGVALLAAIFIVIDWQAAWLEMKKSNPLWLCLAALIFFAMVIADGLRLHLITPVKNLPLINHISLSFQSSAVAQFGLGALSGDLYRAAGYGLYSRDLWKSASHILVIRMIGIITLIAVVLAMTTWALLYESTSLPDFGLSFIWPLTALFLGLMFLGLWLTKLDLSRLPRFLKPLGTLSLVIKKATPSIWFISLAIILAMGVSFACILYALGFSGPLFIPIIAALSARIVSLIPITIGGLGLREGAYISVLSLFSIAPETAFAAAILMRLISGLATIIGIIMTSIWARHTRLS